MTILQLRCVLLTAEQGSISAAAKELGVSQPNASSSIRLLEEEIGFSIFHRVSTGVALTKKGELFLEHARQILEENEKIMHLKSTEEIYRLRLGCLFYFPAVKAFADLCGLHRDDPEADFRYFSVSVGKGIEKLTRRELDIVIAPVMRHQITGLVSECRRNGITLTSLCEIPSVVNVRKGHPAALDGRCLNLTQGSSAMKDFPYIGYHSSGEDSSSTGYKDSDFVQCSYKIYVDEVDAKLQLISATDGFSFGLQTTNELMQQYGLEAFPVPGVILEAFALTRAADTERREITDYLTLLHRELEPVRIGGTKTEPET